MLDDIGDNTKQWGRIERGREERQDVETGETVIWDDKNWSQRRGEVSARTLQGCVCNSGGRIIYQAKQASLNRLKLNNFNKTEQEPGAHSGLLLEEER